jgi:hypothetical protein
MLDLFLKLIDRLIDLAKRRQEINKASFTDLVAPTMVDLEAIHKDYLDSFRRYSDLIDDETIPLKPGHPVLEAIRKDNLFSEGLRAKILQLDPLIVDNEPFGRTLDFPYLLRIMKWYLSGAAKPPKFVKYEDDLPRDLPSQVRRTSYSKTLEAIIKSKDSDQDKRHKAKVALEDSVRKLQASYGNVIFAYAEVKQMLLKPK